MATDTPHSLLSPSKAPRWMRCAGSVALSLGASDESSEYADEGTAAHELAASALLSEDQVDCDAYLGLEIKVKNTDGTVRRTFTVDEDMASYVQVYVDDIRRRASGCQLLVEQRVDYSEYVGMADQSGTADAVILDHEAGTIEVHDLKYGRGVQVSAHENEQLLCYALGAMSAYDLLGDWQTFKVFVQQPRLDHVDEYEVSREELLEFAARVSQAGRAAASCITAADDSMGSAYTPLEMLEKGLLNPHEEACRWCPVKATCPALKQQVYDTVIDSFDTDDEPVAKDAEQMPITELPTPGELELAEMFIKAVRSRVQQELLAGHPVRGWKLVEGKRGARQWAKDRTEELEKKLKNMRLKKHEKYDEKLKSPTQLIDKVLKGQPKRQEALAEFVTRSEPGWHIAPEDDPRPAVGHDAAEQFETDDDGGDLL